ncbi:hypothetical protein C7T35_15300 [Variovorax sp. WS11]|uniref:hypothetical protein n=1 Tax=Variovorax sp. WS11 TaxID=1105204 RepID=UPI000D0D4625|nr:hypothetical protein [Variovorax sp. WS11]NDZ12072.1 hypothetical protein [Variovorax sp. WS11]PSL83747.1 hypothetical protein C7T35_15300 [Variovorax sp. WS11]
MDKINWLGGAKAANDARDEPTGIEGIEVTDATAADWVRASVGLHMGAPRLHREKVVPLKAAPPESWRLL